MARIVRVTLNKEQEAFVRANYQQMSTYQLATAMGLTQTKVFENLQVMKLKRERKLKNRRRPARVIDAATFDIDSYYEKNLF
jgi:hypothetical protein